MATHQEEQEALDTLGRILMTRVRDKSVSEWDRIVAGEMKDASSRQIHSDLHQLGDASAAMVSRLIPAVVDTVIHHLLWTLEQEQRLDLVVRLEKASVSNLRDVSDGLPGELYTEEGWIARFSRERRGDVL